MARQDFVVGDTLKTAAAKLFTTNDEGVRVPLDLSGKSVLFRMVSAVSPYPVKVPDRPAVIDDAPNGEVHYEWQSTEVDAMGLYWGWFIVVSGGAREHFPKGYEYEIVFHSNTGIRHQGI